MRSELRRILQNRALDRSLTALSLARRRARAQSAAIYGDLRQGPSHPCPGAREGEGDGRERDREHERHGRRKAQEDEGRDDGQGCGERRLEQAWQIRGPRDEVAADWEAREDTDPEEDERRHRLHIVLIDDREV